MMEEEVIPDPAEDDPSLSAQVGEETFCAGPVMFPMAEGADADRWAQEFGYPLESQTGNISLGGLMDEVRASDEAGRFMLEVYDEIVRLKGGEGSEQAAAFLSNFMPLMPNSGDERKISCYLTYLDTHDISMSLSGAMPSDSGTLGGEAVDRPLGVIGAADAIMNNRYEIVVTRRKTTSIYYGVLGGTQSTSTSYTAQQAAANVIAQVEQAKTMNLMIDWMIFGANVLLVFAGVGVTVGAIRIATTAGARLMASTALAFEVADGTEYITGFVGGKGAGYNPLKEAFKAVGSVSGGDSGAQAAEHVYNTLNIAIGFGGKAGLTAGSLYGAAMMPSRCQPVDGGTLEEQKLPSQGTAQRTVF